MRIYKVLIITSEFPPGPGGIGNHCYNLADQLSNKFEVVVIGNADYTTANEVELFDGNSKYKIVRFKRFCKISQIIRVYQLSNLILREKFDVTIHTGLFSIWLVHIVSFFTKNYVKKIGIIHGHEPIFGSKIQQRFTLKSLMKFNVLVPVSKFSELNLTQNLENYHPNRVPKHIVRVPNGINTGYLENWSKINHNYNNETDISMNSGYPKLLTVGHTSPRKGQHNVIAALPKILGTFPDTYYYVVGRDVNNNGLMELAKNLGVDHRVVFLPPVNEQFLLESFYKKADVFMLLSENQEDGDVEGFGIVALEANFFGCPVIGSKGNGVEDAVNHGYSGQLVDSKNSEEILEATKIILSNYQEYQIQSKEHCRKFEWSKIIEEYDKIICAE